MLGRGGMGDGKEKLEVKASDIVFPAVLGVTHCPQDVLSIEIFFWVKGD